MAVPGNPPRSGLKGVGQMKMFRLRLPLALVVAGSALAAGAPLPLRGGRAGVCERQHGRREHGRRVRPARRRDADTARRVSVRGRRRRHRRTGSVRRAPCSCRATGAICSRSTPGSNQISVLRIKPHGQLQPVEGSPVASGGIEPVSIAVHGSLVYVANAGTGGSNYTGFTLNPGGHLRPISNSTVPLPDGSQPGDVLFSGDGSHLVGVRVATSLIDSFSVGDDGRLTAAPELAVRGAGAWPVRQRVPANQPEPALRLQRPRRHPRRHRVRVQRRRRRHLVVDRVVAVP